jgi:hypothetical protein
VLPTRNCVWTTSNARWAVAQGLDQDLLALAGRGLRGERAFHFAERAHADRGIRGHRRLLLRGPNLHLRLERAPLVDRGEQVGAEIPDRIVVILQHEEIAGNAADAGGEGDRRQPRRLGFADPIEGRRDAPLRGDDIRAPFEELRGQAGRDRLGLPGQARRDRGGRRGIASDEQLQRADRLLARQLDLAQRIARRAHRRPRHVEVLVIAGADARTRVGQPHELLALLDGPSRDLGLQCGLRREEPAPRHNACDRFARVEEVRLVAAASAAAAARP